MKIKANLTPELVNVINNFVIEEYALAYINDLDKIKNFFITQWHELPRGSDANIKKFLIDICSLQNHLESFVQEGDSQ